MMVPPSWPKHLPKAWPPCTIILRLRFQYKIWQGWGRECGTFSLLQEVSPVYVTSSSPLSQRSAHSNHIIMFPVSGSVAQEENNLIHLLGIRHVLCYFWLFLYLFCSFSSILANPLCFFSFPFYLIYLLSSNFLSMACKNNTKDTLFLRKLSIDVTKTNSIIF